MVDEVTLLKEYIAHLEGALESSLALNKAQASRKWVGLTDEERVQAFVGAGLELAYLDYDVDMKISKVIESRLKEKNT